MDDPDTKKNTNTIRKVKQNEPTQNPTKTGNDTRLFLNVIVFRPYGNYDFRTRTPKLFYQNELHVFI
jgi:hypothetical protein